MAKLSSGGNMAIGAPSALQVVVEWAPLRIGESDVDASVFLLKADGKVRSDADFVFYNQPEGGGGAVVLKSSAGRSEFWIEPGNLPVEIEKLAFALTIHGSATFASAGSVQISLPPLAEFAPVTGGMTESALILGELYRRNAEWKFRALGQGFKGGLDPLARHHGVDVSDGDKPATPVPLPAAGGSPRIDLQKKVATEAPRLVNLAKTAGVSITKNNLTDVVARVGLVLDASASMQAMYEKGRLQEVVERILPLAVHFDDDGSLDAWAFGESCLELNPVTLRNVDRYVDREKGGWRGWMREVNEWVNDEPAAIRKVVGHYFPTVRLTEPPSGGLMAKLGFGSSQPKGGRPVGAPRSSKPPVYVIFISDGAVGKSKEIEQLLVETSGLPIFWQFVGIAGDNYGILEHFDTMSGRLVDNCNFFAIDDLKDLSDNELYDRLLKEFPMWLKEARSKSVIR